MKKSFKIDKSSIGMRFDRWIKNNIGKIPQSLIEKNLRKGNIKLNLKKAKSSTKLKLNDEIIFFNLNYKFNLSKNNKKFNPNKEIIKESEDQIIDDNENFVVLNKKAGISVQGGTKSKKNLIDIFSKSKVFLNKKPYPVHRLDKATSGVLIIAKNRETAKLLTTLFRIRKIHKTYLAISNGEIEKNQGELNHDLIRYEGKKKILENARTYFRILDRNLNCSLIELKPITGRKHQIRKQLFSIGHCVLGDDKYHNAIYKSNIKNELMLHSYEVRFMIDKRKYSYRALLPEHFKKVLKIKKLKFWVF